MEKTEREKIRGLISEKAEQIRQLQKEISLLKIDDYKLCDDKQWYTEELKQGQKMSNGLSIEHLPPTVKVGRIHWYQSVSDADTGQIIKVERSRVVMINGNFLF